jgi:ElaB/YqjD/DUF883 family membrane-anchored ribosome-binding protein
MSKNTKTAHHDAGSLAEGARDLVAATVDVAGEKVVEARKRLEEALHSARDRAVSGAKATDEYIHDNPYQCLGIALGVGVLLGIYIARRK